MNLIDEFGRRIRQNVTARAQHYHRNGPMEWGAALARAHRDASDELRARFNRVTTVPSISAMRSAPEVDEAVEAD